MALHNEERWRAMMTIILKLTGGRPMTHISSAFRDVVNGRMVHYWRDQFGREWLAHGRWSLFRVPRFSANGRERES